MVISSSCSKMELSIKAKRKMGKDMAGEDKLFRMGLAMMVCGKMMSHMVEEYLSSMMVVGIKDSSKIKKVMVMADLYQVMERLYIKANFKMTYRTDLVLRLK